MEKEELISLSLDEGHSEINPKTERDRGKNISVYVDEEQMEQVLKIQTFYRSPSISHAVKLMFEDVAKGLESGVYGKMIRGEIE